MAILGEVIVTGKFLVTILGLLIVRISCAATIIDEDFYGTWSTTSSYYGASRQILELTRDGGHWIQIQDSGEEQVVDLKRADITIEGDVLQVNYVGPEKAYKYKIILSGWESAQVKRMFGTSYLYKDHGEGLNLINAFPVTFTAGVEQLPPQSFWSLFLGEGIHEVSEEYLASLEVSVREIAGISHDETELTNSYVLDRIKSHMIFTKPAHEAHPALIGIVMIDNPDNPVFALGRYAGSKLEFLSFYAKYNHAYGLLVNDVNAEIKGIMERIDVKSEEEEMCISEDSDDSIRLN